MEKLMKFLKNKIVIISIAVVIIIIAILVLLLNKDDDNEFMLDPIYDVYPEEVRELYSNTIYVSCTGDLYLGIDDDSDEVLIENIDKQYMINYLFSHLDKRNKLNNNTTVAMLEDTENKLFNKKLDLVQYINDFEYDEYVYNIKDNMLVRKKSKCESDIRYVSRLYGYSFGTEVLSMDVNIGYLKNGILYDLNDNKLGNYDGVNMEKLNELFKDTSYYRYNYIKKDDDYKLKSVRLKLRTKV